MSNIWMVKYYFLNIEIKSVNECIVRNKMYFFHFFNLLYLYYDNFYKYFWHKKCTLK
jgi:hypothetical protein